VTQRFGNLFDGPDDVKNHDWFDEINWDNLTQQPP